GAPGVLRVERPVQRQATPWRVAVVGSPATIAGSDLVDDLAAPAAGVDWSWVRPGRVAWSWWADSGSPASLAAQEAHVDFAARQGWEYVLADEGWDPAWMPALVEYARARGVGVLLWSRWDALRTPAQRDALLSQWADWGVAGVKLDFMESDSPARMAWYRAVARAAAERRMVVDFHGSTAPRGLERTWPNVLTSEAVRGAEGYKGTTPPTPAQNTVLPFTRNAIGAMDFTPVTFSAPGRATSAGHELALSVVFASGLQHFADSPAAYAARPLAAGWLAEVPAAWDDTRLIAGRPGVAATLARRSGDRWYVGSIHAGAAGTQQVPLSFLDPGRAYVAEIVADAAGDALAGSSQAVRTASTLAVPYARDGGFVVRIRPA
ncbi:MAG: glycoside hydrolase family 97 catalytic domain-containing protein, partial [Solirubrobacteraceae bacterium]